jgi:hypothetical protein
MEDLINKDKLKDNKLKKINIFSLDGTRNRLLFII